MTEMYSRGGSGGEVFFFFSRHEEFEISNILSGIL